MSATVSNAFVEEFESLVHHLGQQEASRLYPSCRRKTGTAEKFNFERLASEDMIVKASRHEATPILDIGHSRRVATVETWKWGEAIDQDDEVQMLINAESEYTQAAAMAHGRKIDQIIINALGGDATDGAGGTVSLPAGQKIGQALSSADKLTVALLREARAKLNAAEVMGSRTLAINSKGEQDLLEDPEFTSADYTTRRLNAGVSPSDIAAGYLGFDRVIRTELLDVTTNDVSAFAYVDRCVGLGISSERLTRIAEDPSLSFATRVYMELVMGAVRIEEEGVVEVHYWQ